MEQSTKTSRYDETGQTMNITDKTQSVRSILNMVWNPIGIRLTAADDEYDTYMQAILKRSWTEKELIDYLTYTTRHTIGLPITPLQEATIKKTALALLVVLR